MIQKLREQAIEQLAVRAEIFAKAYQRGDAISMENALDSVVRLFERFYEAEVREARLDELEQMSAKFKADEDEILRTAKMKKFPPDIYLHSEKFDDRVAELKGEERIYEQQANTH